MTRAAMKKLLWAAHFLTVASLHAQTTQNVLTPAEVTNGYVLLFNGTNMTGWRTWNSVNAPTSWAVVADTSSPGNNVLRINSMPIQHLITSDSTYQDFDIKVEYRLVSAANSGMFIRYCKHNVEEWGAACGPEAQISSSNHSDNGEKNRNGTAYEMFPILSSAANWDRPGRSSAANNYGQWQQFRVVAFNRRVAHFGNGLKLLEYEMLSPAWETAFTASKYSKDVRSMTGYRGIQPGSFYFQHHGTDAVGILFRNIRVKKLTSSPWQQGSEHLVTPSDSTSGLKNLTFADNFTNGNSSIHGSQRMSAGGLNVRVLRSIEGYGLAFDRIGDYTVRIDDLRGRNVFRSVVRGANHIALPADVFSQGMRVLHVVSAEYPETFRQLIAPAR